MFRIQDYKFRFHKEGELDVGYHPVRADDGSPSYYQLATIEGRYLIIQATETGDITEYKFYRSKEGAPTLDDAWTTRAGLTYNFFHVEFGNG
jgi:hypothetical protein